MTLAFVALFGAQVSAYMAAFVGIARSGLENPWLLLLDCPLLFAASALVPFALPVRWTRGLENTPSFIPIVTLVSLLSPFLALAAGPGVGLAYPLLLCFGLARSVRMVRGLGISEVALLMLGPPVLAAYLFLQIHGRAYAHVWTPEFAQLELLQLDTYWHTAMSHMIQNFARGSNGVDGLIHTHYHHGSHAWFAAMAALTDTSPLFTYPYGQIIVAVPALCLGLFYATLLVGDPTRNPATTVALSITAVLLFDRVGWNSYYISESHTWGLVTLLLSLPVFVAFIRTNEGNPSSDRARIALLLALVFISACMKISAGMIFGVGLAWVAFRLYGRSIRTVTIGIALAFIAGFVVTVLVAKTGLSLAESFSFMDFYRHPSVVRNVSRYKGWVAPLLPLICVALVFWYRSNRDTTKEQDVLRGSALVGELVIVVTVASLLPGSTLRLWIGTGWWFTNGAHWMLLPIALAHLETRFHRSSRRGAFAALALLIVGGWSVFSSPRLSSLGDLSRRLLIHSGTVDADSFSSGKVTLLSYFQRSLSDSGHLFDPTVRDGLRNSRGGRLMQAVQRARESRSEPGRFAIFIPPTNLPFWSGFHRQRCRSRPLSVPALTGVPLIKGLPPGCPLPNEKSTHGFRDLDSSARSTISDDASLCAHAIGRGFDTVLMLKSIQRTEQNRFLVCSEHPTGRPQEPQGPRSRWRDWQERLSSGSGACAGSG